MVPDATTENPIRAWRRRLGFTQAEAGRELGYGRDRIADFESGRERPRRCVELAMQKIEDDRNGRSLPVGTLSCLF